MNCLQFISDRIVPFVEGLEGLKNVANKGEVLDAANSVKEKIDNLFKDLEVAGSGDEEESEDELASLMEGETRAARDPVPEVRSPPKVARLRSPSPVVKKSTVARTSSPAPSITHSIADSHNTTDYGMTTDEAIDDCGFLLVPTVLPDITERSSGKIINKVISTNYSSMKDNHTLELMAPLFFLHESYIQISWGLTNAIIDVYN